jgi:hypothetical protein
MKHAHFPAELTAAAVRNLGWEVLAPLCLGSLLFGILCAALSYALTLRLIPLIKTWRVPRWPRPRKKS